MLPPQAAPLARAPSPPTHPAPSWSIACSSVSASALSLTVRIVRQCGLSNTLTM